MARGLPEGLNSRRQFGPAVERRQKSRPRSTGFHGSSPCKCQRLSTLRSSWLPPTRPPHQERGRWPSPRRPRAGSPTPLSASTPDGPTSARWRAWTPGEGPPRSPTPCWPPTSARSTRRAARPPPSPSPPSGFGPSSPASRPPPGQRPRACWAATGARPPTGARARPPRCARTGSPRFSPPPTGPAPTAAASNPPPRRNGAAAWTP